MEYIISLAEFEKSLLRELKNVYRLEELSIREKKKEAEKGKAKDEEHEGRGGCEGEDEEEVKKWLEEEEEEEDDDISHELYDIMFKHWRWTDRVREIIVDSLEDGSETLEEFGGDKLLAYTDSLHWLKSDEGSNTALFRVQKLEQENVDFLSRLGDDRIESVAFVPSIEDVEYWKLLATAYLQAGFPPFEGQDTFEVWEMVHKLILSHLRPENREVILNSFIDEAAFRRLYTFKADASSPDTIETKEQIICTPWVKMFNRESLRALESIDEAATVPSLLPFDSNSRDELASYLRKVVAADPIDDPRSFLHFIPWTQLQRRTRVDIEDIAWLGKAIVNEDVDGDWYSWSPPKAFPVFMHLLHTEDEVYQYCIHNSWILSSSAGGNIMFRTRALAGSGFLEEINRFWSKWNDCAVTQRPDEEQCALLETLPGILWRRLKKDNDDDAARTFFRNLVENHKPINAQLTSLYDVLGGDFSPRYENLLRYIPSTQIQAVEPTPLGEGVNGAVYAAVWEEPSGRLASVGTVRTTPVVLKTILSKFGNQEMRRKLLQELDNTFTALGGMTKGCIRMLGVTVLEVGTKGAIKAPGETKPDLGMGLQLVFERASEGSLLVAARKQLTGLLGIQSWAIILKILSGVGNGLSTSHEHGVFHRDLHPNNVLAHKRHHTTDVQFPDEVSYLISDFGEGKMLSNRDLEIAGESIGAKHFRAPEIRGGKGWTTKADVFAFGVLAFKLLDMRAHLCSGIGSMTDSTNQEPQDWNTVPRHLKEVLEGCLEPQPHRRPDIRAAVLSLDAFSVDLEDNDPEMVIWEWSDTLAQARNLAVDDDDDFTSMSSIFLS